MKIIAHRGGRPENTLEAFQNCTLSEFDGMEFDVWKTSDGEFVIIHDDILDDRRVDSLTLNEIKNIKPSIPTLRETLDLIADKAKHHKVKIPLLNVEIKPFGIAKDLAIWLRGYIYLERLEYSTLDFIITSFLHTEVLKFHREFPEIKVGWIMTAYTMNIDELLVSHYYIDTLVLSRNAINKEYIDILRKTLQSADRDLNIWVYCSKQTAKSAVNDLYMLHETKVDGYITDYPLECHEANLVCERKELRNNHRNVYEYYE